MFENYTPSWNKNKFLLRNPVSGETVSFQTQEQSKEWLKTQNKMLKFAEDFLEDCLRIDQERKNIASFN